MSANQPEGSKHIQEQRALIAAARTGDEAAVAELAERLADLEAEARHGNMLAALLLAKMHEAGLGVEKSETEVYAWLIWGGFKPTGDVDPDMRNELVRMRSHYAETLPESVQDERRVLKTNDDQWAS